jgi:NAD(P)H-nitrite reductase large subunit
MGLEISVVEIANRLLPRQIDERGAAIFEEAVKAKGIKLIKGCAAKEVYGHHKVEHLALGNGDVLEADVVIISAGILADTALAEQTGIECERSIVVDSHMRTNIVDIFAAGDVAQFEGVNYAIWPEAVEQGKVAGANAVGDELSYHGFIPSNVFNNLGVNVFSIGHVNLEGSQETTNLLFENPETGIYKRLLFKNNAMIGGILIGDNKQSKKLIEGIKMGANPHHLLKVLR